MAKKSQKYVKPRDQWTPEEIKLDRLAWAASSRDQMTRIMARCDLNEMQEAHGKAQMDQWWANIQEVK